MKDVLEYCVFEKHLSNLYGSWRIHGKIIPEWKPKNDNYRILTYPVVSHADTEDQEDGEEGTEVDNKMNEKEDDQKVTLYDRFGKVLGRS